ncbi:hypothetical protein [Pseudomonas quasicaspiana]|uniref:hypothetical protein n=1 Tax=Pseudomonas quasicaspiana TaxID=2829821 RepID=UPI001E5EBD77|nr:hypothetical protein [Pseudomonas quasicaspiana]MCD5970760.1 hypothetical protein [Pseudomonas quasicaspiana]
MNSSTDSPPPTQSTPWLTTAIALGTFIIGAVSTAAVGGINFGQQKNALENQTLRIQELQKRNDELDALLGKWREAVVQRDALLATTQSKLTAMQNDQCEAIRTVIENLEQSLEWAERTGMSEVRRSEVNSLVTQHQQSLQSCFAARR